MLNIFSNNFITSQINLFISTKEINFSISKHNTLYIKWKGLGLISLIEKLLKNISPFKNYLGFVKGKAIFGYLWAVPQLFSDCLRILKDKCAPVLEWALSNPPKPHAFTNLYLESGILSTIVPNFLRNMNVQGLIALFFNNVAWANANIPAGEQIVISWKSLEKLLKKANIQDIELLIDKDLVGPAIYNKLYETYFKIPLDKALETTYYEPVGKYIKNIENSLMDINQQLSSLSIDNQNNTLILFIFIFWIASISIVNIPVINLATESIKVFSTNPIKTALWTVLSTLFAGGVGSCVYSILSGLSVPMLSLLLASSVLFFGAVIFTSKAIKNWLEYHDLVWGNLISRHNIVKGLKKVFTSWKVWYFIAVSLFCLSFYNVDTTHAVKQPGLLNIQKRDIEPIITDPTGPNGWQEFCIRLGFSVLTIVLTHLLVESNSIQYITYQCV